MHKKTFILICLLATLETHADGPTYQVFPQLKNLKVNYHVETKKKQTTIYATNHESFAIICDAAMNTNKQDKSKGRETRIEPTKTTAFSFPHRSAITDVRIYLMCEASKDEETTTSETEGAVNEATEKENTAKKIENETGKSTPVIIEEDLDNI
jgi:endonuclease I